MSQSLFFDLFITVFYLDCIMPAHIWEKICNIHVDLHTNNLLIHHRSWLHGHYQSSYIAAELWLYGKFGLTDCRATVPSITEHLLCTKSCAWFWTYYINYGIYIVRIFILKNSWDITTCSSVYHSIKHFHKHPNQPLKVKHVKFTSGSRVANILPANKLHYFTLWGWWGCLK